MGFSAGNVEMSEINTLVLPPLSQRMRTIVKMVPDVNTVADIGCDHGYISIYLAKSGKCRHCIAADVNEGPIESAKLNIEKYNAEDVVEARLSNGLCGISEGEADCILISGMGGALMIDILERDIKKARGAVLVLEPQSEAGDVRRFLYNNGFEIRDEALCVERGKYYPVILSVYTGNTDSLNEEEYVYGPQLLRKHDGLLKKYLIKEKARLEIIIEMLKASDGEAAADKHEKTRKELEVLNRAMENFDEIILASGSPRRRELLTQIGIKYRVIKSGANENIGIQKPDELVSALSKLKCEDVAADIENGAVLGADTVVALDGEILGKPTDAEDAKKMLKMLSGRTHQVYTGVTLIKKEGGNEVNRKTFFEVTDVKFAELDECEIDSYVATGESMDKAGAYGIQGVFAKFVERLDGDYFNVVGLPVARVYSELKKL